MPESTHSRRGNNETTPSGTASTIDDSSRQAANRATVLRFSEAWSRGDVDTLLSLMSDDPTYRGSTGPGPGTCFRGQDEVRAAFARMVTPQSSPGAPAPEPRMFFFEDQALVYWHLSLRAADGTASEVDGVDVLSFTDDSRIAVKDAYRKAFP